MQYGLLVRTLLIVNLLVGIACLWGCRHDTRDETTVDVSAQPASEAQQRSMKQIRITRVTEEAQQILDDRSVDLQRLNSLVAREFDEFANSETVDVGEIVLHGVNHQFRIFVMRPEPAELAPDAGGFWFYFDVDPSTLIASPRVGGL